MARSPSRTKLEKCHPFDLNDCRVSVVVVAAAAAVMTMIIVAKRWPLISIVELEAASVEKLVASKLAFLVLKFVHNQRAGVHHKRF